MEKEHQEIINFLNKNNVSYVLMRARHKRKTTDLDILLEHKKDQKRINELLKNKNYVLLAKDSTRRLYGKITKNRLSKIDVFNEVSYLGFTLISKKEIFRKKEKLENVFVPCKEDELLMYIAQALFKNFGLNEEKKAIIKELSKNTDKEYITKQAKKYGYGSGLSHVIRKTPSRLGKIFVIKALLKNPLKLIRLFLKSIIFLFKKLKRRTFLVCFLGVDGSGKSTIAKETSNKYKKILDTKTKTYYFGWKPFLPLTKFLSSAFKKKKYSIVESMNIKKQKFSIIQEIMLLYYYIEFISIYFFKIFFTLKKKQIIIFDRYFYDMYVHYNYAKKSKIFKILMKLFPKPDNIFIFYGNPKILLKRKKEHDVIEIQRQVNDYMMLQKQIKAYDVDTTKNNIEETVDIVISKTWKKALRRLE